MVAVPLYALYRLELMLIITLFEVMEESPYSPQDDSHFAVELNRQVSFYRFALCSFYDINFLFTTIHGMLCHLLRVVERNLLEFSLFSWHSWWFLKKCFGVWSCAKNCERWIFLHPLQKTSNTTNFIILIICIGFAWNCGAPAGTRRRGLHAHSHRLAKRYCGWSCWWSWSNHWRRQLQRYWRICTRNAWRPAPSNRIQLYQWFVILFLPIKFDQICK